MVRSTMMMRTIGRRRMVMMMKKILEPIKGFHQAGKWGTGMMKTMMRIYIEYNADVKFVRLFVTRNDHSEKISLSV